jgi:oligoendopeptidase F
MSTVKTLPPRSQVRIEDQWDLTPLYQTDTDWEAAFTAWEKQIPGYDKFKGRLAQSAEMISAMMQFDASIDRTGDKLGTYAFLQSAGDSADSNYQRMKGRFQAVATKAAEASSFIRPELMAIPVDVMNRYLKSPELAEWKLALDRTLRYRPHTLTAGEENLLAMQGQMSTAAGQAFRQLTDADLKWPAIENELGEKVELGHSSFSAFLLSPDRAVRKNAFHTYYTQFEAHRNTLAACLNGGVQRDVYYARARNYKTARESSLFHDNVPVAVYDNLVASVRKNLPAVHKYYDLRKRAMKLDDGVHSYDTYVPILSDLKKHHTWDQAVDVVLESLAPLGSQYTTELHRGLTKARWCDRFPNAGKQSGAFSSGCFDSEPYIMMNFQEEVLDHVFTLTHEAGHSMHSFLSRKNQPFQYSGYTIFVAEVASTFNEQLLAKHLMKNAKSDREKAYLINKQIDGIRGTIVRQTMFAEFEKASHALVEAGEPLTVDTLRAEYRKLLEAYFGPDFVLDKELELECLRIPHFYSAFYVYKYATGLSAAIALSEGVTTGGPAELNAYLSFLKGGSSKWPLDLLRDAGVDMETPGPVDAALSYFGKLVDELDALV